MEGFASALGGVLGGPAGGSGTSAGQAVMSAAGGVTSQLAGFGANAVLGAISDWVVSAAQWLLGQIGGFLSSSTRPDLTAHWFTSHYQVMAGVAAAVVVPLLLVSAIQSIMRQDPSPLVRAAVVHLPLALLLAAVSVELVQLSLAAVDALSSTVSASAGGDTSKLLSEVATALEPPASVGEPGAPAFVVFIGALVVVFAAFALWLELIMRTAAVYVALMFLPLALAGLVWPSTMHWSKRLAETLAALVLSKLVIVAVLSLAAAALANGKGFAQVLAGAALLLLASFSPFALLRLLPAVELGAVSQLEGVSRKSMRSLPLPSLDTIDSLLLSATAGGAGVSEAPASGIQMAQGTPYRPWRGGEGNGPGSFGEDVAGGPGDDPSDSAGPADPAGPRPAAPGSPSDRHELAAGSSGAAALVRDAVSAAGASKKGLPGSLGSGDQPGRGDLPGTPALPEQLVRGAVMPADAVDAVPSGAARASGELGASAPTGPGGDGDG